jgi:hypothetical protein
VEGSLFVQIFNSGFSSHLKQQSKFGNFRSFGGNTFHHGESIRDCRANEAEKRKGKKDTTFSGTQGKRRQSSPFII